MVKKVLFFFTLLSSLSVHAQSTNIYDRQTYYEFKKYNRQRMLTTTFWDPGWNGIFIGPTVNYELGELSYGGELKLYGAIYEVPIFSGSIFTNYSYLPSHDQVNHNIGLGAHASIIGFETNYRFGKEANMWTLTPQFVIDLGNLRFSYGYDFGLINNSNLERKMHRISLKYAINVTGITDGFQSRRKYMRRNGLL